MWDATLQNPIDITESGSAYIDAVWSGTAYWGGRNPIVPLGESFAYRSSLGLASGLPYQWVNWSSAAETEIFPLYGISSDLIVPDATPEPGTVAMMVIGSALILGVKRFRA